MLAYYNANIWKRNPDKASIFRLVELQFFSAENPILLRLFRSK